jgi:transcriptional antiterminator RfaH
MVEANQNNNEGAGGESATAELTCAYTGESRAWYCARTHPKHEHLAARGLKQNLGLEVFHPRLRIERATRRGPVHLIEPLFPCYLFVRCVLAQHLDGIRYTYGMSGVVHFGQRIPSVADSVIDELRQCFESEEPMRAEEPLYAGAEVMIAEGSFLGARGIVVRVLPARQRVQILLDFLGQATLAEVDRKSLAVKDLCLADVMPMLATRPRAGLAAVAA